MNVRLAYGHGYLDLRVPPGPCAVIQPTEESGLPDERGAVLAALDDPIGSAPLKQRLKCARSVCVIFTDITRATPNERLIPWLLEHRGDFPVERITLLNSLGTHRPNTPAELEQMLTPEVARRYRVLNHEPENPAALVRVGSTRDGSPALLNRHCLAADLRIVTGFIEPHSFAGFSGGPKGIMPGVAGMETVLSNHGSRNIGDPNATFGLTQGNPLWEELRDIALLAGPSFLLNVTLNERREITGVYAGDLIQAHQVGCDHVRKAAMQPVKELFDVVVTTNSGYPLDMNLYQAVKGMSAGARIVKPGGTLILACECSEGVPRDSRFDLLLRSAESPEQLLAMLAGSSSTLPEQWQVQIQVLIQRRARVLIYSNLPPETSRAAHLEPCADIGAELARIRSANPNATIAILPQGPLTIPYLV